MGLIDKKITDNAINTYGVVSAPDTLEGTAQQNKMVFDKLIRESIKGSYNELIDILVGTGGAAEIGIDEIEGIEASTVQEALSGLKIVADDRVIGSEDIKYIRLNSDNEIEVSADGEEWYLTASSGHIILNSAGQAVEQTPRLQFNNTTVTVENGITKVEGLRGQQGIQGPKGDQGDQGIQGPTGKVIVPTINSLGDISWELSDDPVVPETRNIQGPQGNQGPRGLQGIQGIQGPQGPAGSQGVQGPQGPQGIQGNDGADGRSFTIQDIYPTLAALKQAFPTGNEYAYQVTAEDNEIFIWSELQTDWISVGKLQGPQGPQGIQGVPGPQGPQGIQGIQGVQGPAGEDGEDGKTAYESALDGGYVGTESKFNTDLAAVSSKYQKPSTGIPKTDLASAVQASLGKADASIPIVEDAEGEIPVLNADGELEDGYTPVTSVSSSSTDTEIPTAKAVHTVAETKALKDTDAVSGNVAKFDASGNPIDSGYTASNILGLSYTVVSTWT